ncbi:interleukin-8-like [Hyperolius riggenbachi]|uniref:interleukin-8-like n=1 Tax=Hyperolius riggenbachi TaxID=752182 RepID=UPI0035A2F627
MTFSKTFTVALALFLIFTTAIEGMSIQRSARDLRCQCIKRQSKKIRRVLINNWEHLPSGPHCKKDEVIINLKSGHQVCVNPSATWVVKLLKESPKGKKNKPKS